MNTTIISRQNNSKYDGWKKTHAITFFTPTFNRAKFLPRIYHYLLSQTVNDFVWIIVNDGSQDETDDVCKNFLDSNQLPILYIKKENGGKHSCFKIALKECKTDFFQCMDDDDKYDSNAVEFFLEAWNSIPKDKIDGIGAIRTLSRRKDGSFVRTSSIIPECGYEDCSTLEMNYIKNDIQENWTCYRTDSLRSISLFPSNYWLSENHNFFLESIWQGRFARKFLCRYIYKSLREYTDDATVSILRSKKTRKHYLNMFINSKILLDEQLDYIRNKPMTLVRSIFLIQFLRGYLEISLKDLLMNTSNKFLKSAYLVTSWVSFLGNKMISIRNKR